MPEAVRICPKIAEPAQFQQWQFALAGGVGIDDAVCQVGQTDYFLSLSSGGEVWKERDRHRLIGTMGLAHKTCRPSAIPIDHISPAIVQILFF